MRKLGLVGSFAVRSLLVVAVVAVVLAGIVSLQVARSLTAQSSRSLAPAINSVISVEMGSRMPEQLESHDFALIGQRLRSHLRDTDLTALRVWAPSGKLVYSSAGGTFSPDERDISRALSGEIVVGVHQTTSGRQVVTYSPLKHEFAGSPIGVFEFTQPYAPIALRIRQAQGTILLIVGLGALFCYLVQVGLVKDAANRITRSEAEVRAVTTRLLGSMRDLEEASLGTLQALARAVDAKDSYTARHSVAVADYAVAVGRRIGLDEAGISELERASLLHDIGKIGVPEEILLKPGRLTDEEVDVICAHSEMGATIIESIPFLRSLVPIVRSHHERWDGKGYPDGISGADIPLAARVLAVVDAYDAMTSDRPYRIAMPHVDACAELLRNAGTQFDPFVAEAFVGLGEPEEIAESATLAFEGAV